ncbi:MAG: helix-turn-helix domain-containing protein [Actinomycetota bacterium]|nr:helix-turn-helix domain-containing protein [Actinomycetota bacterium]
MTDQQSEPPQGEPQPYIVPLTPDGRECLSFAPVTRAGWAAYFADVRSGESSYTWLRFGFAGHSSDPTREPIEVRELHVVSDAQSGVDFDSGYLRVIPFRRIEAAVNRPQHRDAMKDLVPSDVLVTRDMPFTDGWSDLTEVPDTWIFPPKPRRQTRPRVRFSAADSTHKRPDDFYAAVADLFLFLASSSPRPAQELAQEAGVPVTTVHRWLREARQRGLLVLPQRRGQG